ncbi:MAG: sensor histidine kinase, partial [Flavobacteriia bacterium]|nr:sensor histidine kinase [Flavobacteriia bacterium]
MFLAASFLFTLIVHLFIFSLNNLTVVLIPLISGGLAYLIFYFLLKQFISTRLSQIYNSIQLSQNTNLASNNSIDTLMDKAEIEVDKWKNDRNFEITRLKEQEQFRREFLGNLAHELKTPVFSIQGYIVTLLEGGLEDKKINRSFLERAERATDRMASILDDLDQITKLEVDELKNEIRSFDIIEVIKETFESLEILAKSKDYKLTFAKEYSPIYVMADRTKIGQVFSNLLGNAL